MLWLLIMPVRIEIVLITVRYEGPCQVRIWAYISFMRDFFTILITVLRSIFILMGPDGHMRLISENLSLRQQLMTLARKNRKSPPLKPIDRIVLAFTALFIPLNKISRVAIIVKPATILKFHRLLVKKKYQSLFGRKDVQKRGRKGFNKSIVNMVIEIKKKNPSFGCPRIGMLITNITETSISEQTVRRILRKYYKPDPGDGPSWLSFIGSQVDSLWSVDLFRVESITLKTHWIMVVMDQYSRRIIGFSIQKDGYSGPTVCRMFNEIVSQSQVYPKRISTDNDPIFNFNRWKANLRIMDIEEIKSVPRVPYSHPFIERLIGSIRREHLDYSLFWGEKDLVRKLGNYKIYYNESRVHCGLDGRFPAQIKEKTNPEPVDPKKYQWKKYCRGLYSIPIAA